MLDPLQSMSPAGSVRNEHLYKKLKDHFPGGVTIANEGEPFLAQWRTQASGRMHASIVSAGEYYRVNCPFCRDNRKRLWINHMFGQDDPNGRPIYFLATCYNDERCLEDYENRKKLVDTLFGFRNMNERRPTFAVGPTQWDSSYDMSRPAELPGQMIPVSQLARSAPGHHAVQYMYHTRRYTTNMLDRYEVSYCAQAAPQFMGARDRIVFPIKMYGNLVGWQARYIGTTDWKMTPKYYGLPGMKKGRMLYNFDFAQGKPFVIVVEGPTDANVVGDHAVALLGKSMSATQLQLLLTYWADKPIILILDPEAEESAQKSLSLLNSSGGMAIQVRLPDGYDCGDYDRATLWNIIHSQANSRGVLLPM